MKKLIALLRDDALFRQSLETELNAELDSELKKDDGDINFEKVEDISKALLFLNGAATDDNRDVPPLLRRFRMRYLLKRYAKVVGTMAAALVLVLMSWLILRTVPQAPVIVPEGTTSVTVSDESTTVPPTTLPSSETVPTETTLPVIEEKTTEAEQTPEASSGSKERPPETETTAGRNGRAVPVTGEALPDIEGDDSYYDAPQSDGSTPSRSGFDEYGVIGTERCVQAIYIGFKSGFQTCYSLGESLDTERLVITVVYDDDASQIVSASQCRLTGYSSDKPGQKIVTVSYGCVSESFSVTVE